MRLIPMERKCLQAIAEYAENPYARPGCKKRDVFVHYLALQLNFHRVWLYIFHCRAAMSVSALSGFVFAGFSVLWRRNTLQQGG